MRGRARRNAGGARHAEAPGGLDGHRAAPPRRARGRPRTPTRGTVASPEDSTAAPRPYSRNGKAGSARCSPGNPAPPDRWPDGPALCAAAPASFLDHCPEHGYVRTPLCRSCNTQEHPDRLYSNDVSVTRRPTRLFDTDGDGPSLFRAGTGTVNSPPSNRT
ncbi:endonuclease domain-containing protein [Streptomyces sp. NPDC002506]|uniref:endonuclease domain-containing protein n=1 Tax=Streptomyces sp. NPDC002506 TaxID=3154536 RepID=UPI00332CF000